MKLLVLCVMVFGLAQAQLGFFDLDGDEDTALRGTTSEVLPQCFSVPTGLCGDGGRTIYTVEGKQKGLIASYTFDDALGLDSSGNANHALHPAPGVGPGHDGHGQSAYFSGAEFFKIGHSSSFDGLRHITVSFWIYLLTDSIDAWRVVFRKGDEQEGIAPGLLLASDTRKLHAVCTSSKSGKVGLDSKTTIPLRRWTHVALTIDGSSLTIFINGIEDNTINVSGDVAFNQGAWYIGKDPFLPGTGMFLDDFKVYSEALEEPELQVEAASSLPGLGPNFLRLGCSSCTMKDAIARCAGWSKGGYHLCRTMELNGGGLIVARAMGYLDMSSEHWTAEDEEADIALTKLGLCCLD